jgi:hypothetical protein
MASSLGFNPWLSMWTKPKSTIRKIVDYNPNFRLYVLSAIYGLVSLISSSQSLALGEKLNFFLILFICLILAPIWGYITFSVSAFFVYFTGKWLKGQANYRQVRASIAWSNVPMIGNLILWIILFIIFKYDILKEFPGAYPITNVQKTLLFTILFAQLVLSIWVIVLYINSLAEVQRFSIGKSILNIIIAIVIIIAILFVISIFYFLALKGFR